MEKGRKEAKIGLESEKELVNMINTNVQFRNIIRRCLSKLGFKMKGKLKAYKDCVKTDIIIETNGSKLGVSIKSSTATSFHQLDRRRLESWKTLLNMPDNVFEAIKEAILRIAYNKKAKFILEKDRNMIANFFKKNIRRMINEIFVKAEQNLELLVVNDKVKRRLYFFKMREAIDFLCKNSSNVNFSRKGIVKLGDFISVQRKSGDGKHIKIPKTNWRHPGNNLQFKFSPLRFAEYIENAKVIDCFEIDY